MTTGGKTGAGQLMTIALLRLYTKLNRKIEKSKQKEITIFDW